MRTKKCGVLSTSKKRMTSLDKRKMVMLEKLTLYFMILFPITFVLSILLVVFLFSGGYITGKIGMLGILTMVNTIPLAVLGILKATTKKLLE